MSWNRVIYVTFVIIVAGVSALFGAFAGGLAVYRALSANQAAVSVTPTQVVSVETAG